MKFLSLGLLSLVLSSGAFAHTFDRTSGPYLEIFIISPPGPINWKSPQTLFTSTVQNSIKNDYAPNGHFIVHISSDRPNKYGVKEVLTGMSRTNKMKTLKQTIQQRLGLNALIHEFSGDLDASEGDIHELATAKKQGRLSSIIIPVSSEKAEAMMNFLDQWITYGSFRHYGGGKNVASGEGSGCADFATHFVKIATDGHIPYKEWVKEVYLPSKLMKEAPNKETKGVGMRKLVFNNIPWGSSDKDGVLFSIPDPEMMIKWINERSPQDKRFVLTEETKAGVKNQKMALEAYKIQYPVESAEKIQSQWEKISNFTPEQLP